MTIKETYTQVVTQTYVVNHYIEYYMYPIIKWVFTLVNIGSQQAPGYHTIGNTKTFLPGYGGGNGIFVPVYAQEAVYAFNIAPSTKPVITGWYVGKTSESSSPPQLASQSVRTYLSGIQKFINNGGSGTGNSGGTYNSGGNGTGNGNNTIIIIYNNTIIWHNNIVYVPVWKKPYFYSQQDIQNAYNLAKQALNLGFSEFVQAGQDLLSGHFANAAFDILGGVTNTFYGVYQAARGDWMVGWNTAANMVEQLVDYMSNPQNPWSIADALGTAAWVAGQTLESWASNWAQAVSTIFG